MVENETTTIQLKRATHRKLRKRENYPDEPFDTIIERLLEKEATV